MKIVDEFLEFAPRNSGWFPLRQILTRDQPDVLEAQLINTQITVNRVEIQYNSKPLKQISKHLKRNKI